MGSRNRCCHHFPLYLHLRSYVEEVSHSILADKCIHFLKHIHSLEFIFLNGVVLSVCTESNTVFELVHIVNMVHPSAVNTSKENDSLNLTHIVAKQLALFFICVHCHFINFVPDSFAVKVVVVALVKIKGVGREEHRFKVIYKSPHIPVVGVFRGGICGHSTVNDIFNHLYNRTAYILSVKHLTTLFID